jgi:hypothetical protein
MNEPEVGGVGTVGDRYYMWMIDDDFVGCCFDTGECLYFDNDAAGWGGFLAFAVVLAGLY